MKKILYVATVDIHINSFHLPFLKMLREKGYEVHVATNTSEKIEYCQKKYKISIKRSPFSLSNLKAIKELKKIINEEKYDIIHCHTPMGSVITRLAAKNSRKKGTKVVYTAHGFHFYKGSSIISWLLYYPIEKYLSKYTDVLVTINQEDYQLATKKFQNRCFNIKYIPGVGIENSKYSYELTKEEKIEIRKKIGLSKNDFVMIFPARLDKNKNQIFLIDAMNKLCKKHSNIHLLLPGTDELNGYYQKISNERKLSKNIHFLGYRNDIPDLMKISDIAVSSSLREGLPVNVLESLSNKMPVIALKCRGMSDLIENGKNGYIVNSLDEFVNKVEDYISNKKTTKESYYNIDKFKIESVKKELSEIYSELNHILILPTCTDLNRGDQALVLETCSVINDTYPEHKIYIMKGEESIQQCLNEGHKPFPALLEHPSRFDKKKDNIKYGITLKIKWGIIASFDFIISQLLLNAFLRKIIVFFLSPSKKKTVHLFEKSSACFVKGGGFLHDTNGGITGLYTMYYQLFHIKLALSLNKKVFIMPNSFGPFKNSTSSKLVQKTLSKCTFVSARESISSNGETNGLKKDYHLFPDLAFFLKSDEKFNAQNYLKNHNIDYKNKKLVALTLRPYRFPNSTNPTEKYKEYKDTFEKFAIWLNQNNYTPLFVVHTTSKNKHEHDYACIEEIIKKISKKCNYFVLNDNTLNCREIKKIYGLCEFVIGTRFHSVIFSVSQGIPAISITYGGNKGDGITKDIDGGKYAIKIEELNFKTLKTKFQLLEKDRKEEIEKLDTYMKKCKVQREEMIKKIKEVK